MTKPKKHDIELSQDAQKKQGNRALAPGKKSPLARVLRQAHILILKIHIRFLRLTPSFFRKYLPESSPEIQPDLASATYDEVKKATHFFFLLLSFLCFSFGCWAYYGKLDVVSIAEGEVVPSTQIKQVQHLEGGIVRRILVQEGQLVEKEQPLVELQTTAGDADVGELNLRIIGLRIEIIRLEAEAAGTERLEFTPDLLSSHPTLVQEAQNLFQARRGRLQDNLKRQKELVTQRLQGINEIKVRLRNQKKRVELLEEQLKISEDLLKSELTNRYQHLDLLKEQNTLKSAIEENGAMLSRAEAALKEEELRMNGIRSTYDEEVQTALEDSRRRYRELTERLRKYEDSLLRTVVRAPVDGVVKTLHVFTEGGVVRPGGTLMDIVPRDDVLVVEAKLPTQDIGYIHVGQKAAIQLNSADARRFGKLNGKVIHISPDTLITEKGRPYYKVRIATEKDYFQYKDLVKYRLYPGMILEVNIQTGQRTVLEYLVSPWITSMDTAMTER